MAPGFGARLWRAGIRKGPFGHIPGEGIPVPPQVSPLFPGAGLSQSSSGGGVEQIEAPAWSWSRSESRSALTIYVAVNALLDLQQRSRALRWRVRC